MRQDGTLFSWGDNRHGKLGHSYNFYNIITPKRINPNHFQGKTIRSIHTEEFHNLAR